jgi:hypothetical protein
MKNVVCLALIAGALSAPLSVIATEFKEPRSDSHLTVAFVQHQVEQNMSIGRAIKSIVGHYPNDTTNIVSTALDLYPEQYKEIIHAAISEQPMLTEAIVTIAIEKGISSCSSIVETAINAEPSYIDFVVTAAANTTPGELKEIVKIAVTTQPDSANYIVQSLAREHPNKIVDIIQSAIGAVPLVGEYVVEALLAVFPNDAEDVVTTAVRESGAQRENVKRIIETAHNSGVSDIDVKNFAINGGATKEEVAQVLDRNN